MQSAYDGMPSLRCDETDLVVHAPGECALALQATLANDRELRLHLHVQQLDGGVVSLCTRALPHVRNNKLRGIAYMQAGSGGWCPGYLDSVSVAPSRCEEPFAGPPALIAFILQRALVFCARTRTDMRLLVQPWEGFDRDVVYMAVEQSGLLSIEDHEWEFSLHGVTLKLKQVRDDGELLLTVTPIKPWARMSTHVAISMHWRHPDTRTR